MSLLWPQRRVADALEALARAARLPLRGPATARRLPDVPAGDAASLGRFVEDAAAFVGVETEPTEARYADVDELLRRSGPALVLVDGDRPGWLALMGARGDRLRVIGPEGPVSVPLAEARRLVRAAAEAELVGEIDDVANALGGLAGRGRRARLHEALLSERLQDRAVVRAFLLRDPPSARVGTVARRLRLGGRLGTLLVVHAVQYLMGLAGWVVVGRGALSGSFDRGWLAAWLLILLSLIPFQLVTSWLSGALAIDIGAVVKQRLLAGVLALEPEEIRHQGVGGFMALAFESSAVEALGIGGGFAALLAGLELVVSMVVLGLGAGGLLQALSLAAWTALGIALGVRYYRRRLAWTERRLRLTNDLVERLVGHRTRLAQEEMGSWHDEEDRALADYLAVARRLDRAQVTLAALLSHGWLVIGAAGLLASIVVARGAQAVPALAVSLGGVLLAQRALARLTAGMTQIAGAAIAWHQVRPLLASAARAAPAGVPDQSAAGPAAPGQVVAEAHELTFRYPDRARPILRGATLTVRAGDRVLLLGASGGGKSTLAALLAGMRAPSSGLVLVGGLDRATLGANGWRRRVVTAPQFHENHVFSAPLAFNLLLGRGWPPERRELEEAEAVCRELGLGPLLDRMPGGMSQMVGDTGWQLSHGERSRVYIARALLQGADLLVLDESFAALDPQTLANAMDCVLGRAPALMVIAHP